MRQNAFTTAAPLTAGGAYSAPQTPWLDLEGKSGKGRGRKGEGKEGRGERKGRGEDVNSLPNKNSGYSLVVHDIVQSSVSLTISSVSKVLEVYFLGHPVRQRLSAYLCMSV